MSTITIETLTIINIVLWIVGALLIFGLIRSMRKMKLTTDQMLTIGIWCFFITFVLALRAVLNS